MLLKVVLLLLAATAIADEEPTDPTAVIFYNEACGGCDEYVHKTVPRILGEYGVVDPEKRDYINDRGNRVLLNRWLNRWSIPLELESHIMVFVDGVKGKQIVLAGHVPEQLIRSLFTPENLPRYERILLYQDKMYGAPTRYVIWKPGGPIQEYPIDTPLSVYLDLVDRGAAPQPGEARGLLPLVLVSGLSDGINPCAIAVLIFFVALLYHLRRNVRNVLIMGTIYISVIYLTYLSIGLGLLKAIRISGVPHLMAKIGAGLMILLGLVSLKNFLFPKKLKACLRMPMDMPTCLKVPRVFIHLIERWLSKATIPAVIIASFLVGMCTFPCSGGIYVAILGLLASVAWKGVGYLLIYNLMFVVPLMGILAVACNPLLLRNLAIWQNAHQTGFRLASGMAILALGVAILWLFT
jgi:cytochrome c biogenesis protein CcdA